MARKRKSRGYNLRSGKKFNLLTAVAIMLPVIALGYHLITTQAASQIRDEKPKNLKTDAQAAASLEPDLAVQRQELAKRPSHSLDGRIKGEPDVKDIGNKIRRFDPSTKLYSYESKDHKIPTYKGHIDGAAGDADGRLVQLPPNTDSPVCKNSGRRIVVVYTYSTTPDPLAPAAIRNYVRRMNYKLIGESFASSAGSVFRQMYVECDSTPEIKVYKLSLAGNINPDPDVVRFYVEGALGVPVGGNAKKYLIFTEGTPNDPRMHGYGWGFFGASKDSCNWTKLAVDNCNANYTTSGIIWKPWWSTHITLHELGHAMGAVQNPLINGSLKNPLATVAGHCIDGFDPMCYNDLSYFGDRYSSKYCWKAAPSTIAYDCHKDTYFNAKPPAGSFLDKYWNIGGAQNPFLKGTP